MRDVFPGPSYMERILNVPPEAAAAALDLALLDVGRGSVAGNGSWVVELERGRLVVEAPSVRFEADVLSGVCPLRRANGWIRSGVFRFSIELELVPWSDSASAIGLRPGGRRPRRIGSDVFYRVGAAGLEHVRNEILHWAHAGATARRRVARRV